eukprot:TRINITY_DN44811_c0_g1_i1.p1 TRINITY_DN44811_c0_g1~~TRINITY_DN44811_c0_g1_i1.p1  ORF type:complete len:155 (+),score=11.97 TRINITY_DN44811_c0_g1_i1:105-569(+)
MSRSRTLTAFQCSHEVDHSFGHYAPPAVWQRGVGGGYHDPVINTKGQNQLDFQTWMEKWTTPQPPSASLHRKHVMSKMDPSPLQMVPSLNLQQTAKNSSRPATGEGVCPPGSTSGAPLWQTAPKTSLYPNPTNWKRSTSLPTRNPGHVGALRTR